MIPDYQRPYSWGKDECMRLWDDFIKNKLSKSLNNRLKRGICILNASINDKQKNAIPKSVSIEHILPKKRENYKYNDWDQNKYRQHCEELGNLVPLEKALNIKSRDQFFPIKNIL